MANIDLSKYGITGTTEIVYNPSYDTLFEEETKPELEGFEKGQVSELGAVNVMTGIYTGRSPKDKYIVMDENSRSSAVSSGVKDLPCCFSLLLAAIMTGAASFKAFPSICSASSFMTWIFTGSIFLKISYCSNTELFIALLFHLALGHLLHHLDHQIGRAHV